MPFRKLSIIAVSLLTLLWGSFEVASAGVIYSNDFSANINGFNGGTRALEANDGSSQNSPIGSSLFLGPFSLNGNVILTLNGLTVGAQYTLQFDLKIAASWDGNDTTFGPDRWSLTTSGTSAPTLINTTFSNLVPADGNINNNFTQNYSDANLTASGTNPAFTGADVLRSNVASPNSVFDRYAIYYFGHGAGNPSLTFSTTNATASFTFAGFNLQGQSDEYWAIDNVVASTVDSAAVPEPASMAIWGFGAVCCAIAGYRRRTMV